ncbi:hypothetical protein GF319_14645 [Candidatus Bathyarchaeota archaeon]|nr:hypothetical protein [Candidatus Bathyarchaeota archaeon]
MEKQVCDLLPPEEVLRITIEHLRENYPEAEDLESSDDWTFTDLTENIYIEKSLTEYKSKGWTIRIQSPAIGNPVYRVEAENDLGFEWSADFFVTQLLERIQKTDNR